MEEELVLLQKVNSLDGHEVPVITEPVHQLVGMVSRMELRPELIVDEVVVHVHLLWLVVQDQLLDDILHQLIQTYVIMAHQVLLLII